MGGPGDDCDDSDPSRYPGNPEVCDPDGHDEDCDPQTIGPQDDDGDGHIDVNCSNGTGASVFRGSDCDDGNASVHPGSPEVCNRVDDDCDGSVDAADTGSGVMTIKVWVDGDRDGFGGAGGTVDDVCPIGDLRGFSINDYDCDDANPRRHPGTGCP